MSGLLPGMLLQQSEQDIRGEGLPFWLFWLLLCVILLLLVFIFLRDKDLRRRLSAFLSGAKRKMLRIRLQAKIKKEKKKKGELLKDLGKLAWSEDIPIPATEETCRKLKQLEEEQDRYQMEWHEVYSKIEALGKSLDDARKHHDGLIEAQEAEKKPDDEIIASLNLKEKGLDQDLQKLQKEIAGAENELRAGEKEIMELEDNSRLEPEEKAARVVRIKEKSRAIQTGKNDLEKRIPGLEEAKAKVSAQKRDVQSRIDAFIRKMKEIEEDKQGKLNQHEKEIREMEKKKVTIQEKIIELRKHTEPLFETLGKAADEARPENKDLSIFYFQVDRINQTIQELAARIEKLQ